MRRSIVVGTKADLVDDAASAARALGAEALAVSAVTGDGLEDLLDARRRAVEGGARPPSRSATPYVVLRPGAPAVHRERARASAGA